MRCGQLDRRQRYLHARLGHTLKRGHRKIFGPQPLAGESEAGQQVTITAVNCRWFPAPATTQAVVAPPADEAFRERILLRLAGCDVVPANLALLVPSRIAVLVS